MPPRSVFVYGSLLPDRERWPLLEPFVVGRREATMHGTLWDTGFGYPALQLHGPDDAEVPGMVLDLDPARSEEAVRLLDRIEGDGHLYRRVDVVTSAGPAFAHEWLGSVEGFRRIDRWTR